MSGTYDPTSGMSTSAPGFELGAPGYQPTPPAPTFLGVSDPAYQSAPQYAPPPQYGAPQAPYAPVVPVVPAYPAGAPGPYGQPNYQVYDPTSAALPVPMQYPAQPYPTNPGQLVPGQLVPTRYGTFVVGGKSKLAAGLLGIFLGGLGVGQFYRGNVGMGVAQLLVTAFTFGIGGLWGFIEGIVVLASQPGSPSSLDSLGQLMS